MKDIQKPYAQPRGTASSGEERKQAQILHGQPKSTSMARQICQKTNCSSLAQLNLVRNETGGCWRWTPGGRSPWQRG